MFPVLTVNRSFMHEFMDAEPPCGALGLVEENGRQSGFVALHLDADIPSEVTARGFRLGHSLLGGDAFEVIHLAFEFYGFRTWNLLINPNNPLVQAVLTRMFEDEDYFFFALEFDRTGDGLSLRDGTRRALLRESASPACSALHYDRDAVRPGLPGFCQQPDASRRPAQLGMPGQDRVSGLEHGPAWS